MKNSSFISLLFIYVLLPAQENNYQLEIAPFNFFSNGVKFSSGFFGGLNNPEFQFIDLDDDEDYDLFILNSDGSVVWFENTGHKFNPGFTYSTEQINGLKIYDWFYFIDIDADVDFDLFTGQTGSKVTYLENVGDVSNPVFELKMDTVRNILNNDLNVEAGSNPGFVDIDNDGDYDLISGNTSGTANFYRNIGTPEQFLFDTLDGEWQNLRVGFGKVNLSHHGASTLEFADIDKDFDFDLFWGDLFNTSLYLIKNNGTPTEPVMQIETEVYPLNEDSISTKGFNMSRFVDIDSDGDLDLFTSVLWNDLSTKETITFRRNNGGNQFELITKNFLNIFDVGSRSAPDLIDVDNDGDLDLFIGAESTIGNGTIYYFNNTGSPQQAQFELSDSSFANIQTNQIAVPSFGDIDNDGDYDLVVAEFFNNILLYENTGNSFVSEFHLHDTLHAVNNDLIKAGTYPRAKLFDVDSDNDLDLIFGNFNGEVLLYKNVGSPGNYAYEEDPEYFNIIKPGNYTNPTLFDYDDDGIFELFVGLDNGNILLYENISNETPGFTLSDTSFLNTNFGKEPNVTFADIDNDGDDDIFIGNIKGGLNFFRNNTITGINDRPLRKHFDLSINAYPNPFNGTLHIEMYVPKNLYYSLRIFNILGAEVSLLSNGISTGEVKQLTWNTNNFGNNLSSGVYILSIQTEVGLKSLPIVYLK